MVKRWREEVGYTYIPPSAPIFKLAFDPVLKLKDNIIREAKRIIDDVNLKPTVFENNIGYLRDRIINLLPPNEYLDPSTNEFITADHAMILNAAWLSYLEDLDLIKSKLSAISEEKFNERYFGLITKGIELSEISHRWAKYSS
jgi:hypothetical protein